jgi:hypothetical protein
MNMIFALSLGLLLALLPLAHSQDKETEEQIKQANEAAKKMGMKTPDMQKLMDESAKEDAADEAAEQKAAAEKEKSPANARTDTASVTSRAGLDIPAGGAKGTLTFDGVTAELKFAAAYIDQKDDRKPVVLVVSDQKLPFEKWSSEFDMMRDQTKWSGLVFFLDKDGAVYRTDVHTKGRQSSVSGIFDLKLNDPTSADLAGAAKTDSSAKDQKLDVTFHATRK